MHRLLGPDTLDLSNLGDQLKNLDIDLSGLDLNINIDADQIREQAREAAEQAREQVRNIDVDQIREQARQAAEQAREQVRNIDVEQIREQAREAAEQARSLNTDQIREQAEQAREMAREQADRIREQSEQWRDIVRDNVDRGIGLGFGQGFAFMPQTPMPAPAPPPPPKVVTNFNFNMRGRSADSLYERGLSSLDRHQYDQALDAFTEVVARGGSHVEGALYWKAYSLNKLGRRDEATAALAELHKTYPSSHWLDDAKALEIEVKQSSGKPVSPDAESNDDLKLLALEGLAQSDPDRAFPRLEQMLKQAQSPTFKRRAVYVLALSSSPKAQQLLEQIARGGANPDIQITAIRYLGSSSKNANKSQVLFEIYNGSTDPNVKRAAMDAMLSNRDKDHLLQIAKSDKDKDLREEAIRKVASLSTAPDIWALYQAETDPEVKRTLLDYMSSSTDKLLEVARTEKDPKLRRSAIQRLSGTRTAVAADALVQIYGTESDPQVKRSIVDALMAQRNGVALVAVARKENDLETKRYIVRRMLEMKSSPEINAFLEDLLK